MSDFTFLMFGAGALVGLAYCLWKTHADLRNGGFGMRVLWGAVASLSAFFFVGFLFAGNLLAHL